MNSLIIKNNCGVSIVTIEQISLPELGRLMADIFNIVDATGKIKCEKLYDELELKGWNICKEMIMVAINELTKEGEILFVGGILLMDIDTEGDKNGNRRH